MSRIVCRIDATRAEVNDNWQRRYSTPQAILTLSGSKCSWKADCSEMMYGSLNSGDEHTSLLSRGVEEDGTVRNQLGVINGVLIPCLLNILGVILFLRLSWAVGHAGVFGTIGMFLIGETLALLTVFSLSAIVSNGRIKGGGSYYMISRCLGPEMGGSIGLLFYSAYAVGTCFYVIGFATEIVDTFIVEPEIPSGGNEATRRLWTTVVASAALAVVMIISLLGAGFFTKINILVFLIQFGAILTGILSMWFAAPGQLEGGGTYLGPRIETLLNNTWPEFSYDEKCGDRKCTFAIVFSIIFPAMTGIMEGANLSGDLKDASAMIGPGTVAAVFVAILTYLALIFSFAAGFPRETLKTNMSPMQDVAPSKYIVITGIAISAGSSALGSVFGGSRVLQALARDDLPFPGLSYFAKGSKHGDEPRRAVLLTWFVAQCCCLIGDLDVVSPIISSFFCMSYASVNFCCLVLEISGTPNFRPRFSFYSRWSAAFGFMLNIAVLFYLNVLYAVCAIFILLVLIIWIALNGPVKDWGDVSQALMFHQVRKYLLRLDERREHPKYWRPSVLLLLNNIHDLNSPLIKFCNSLKKGGLYILGTVVVGDLDDLNKEVLALRRSMMTMIQREQIKALPQVCIAPSARLGFQNLILCSGLGGMRPNTVVVPLVNTEFVSIHNNKGYYQNMALSLLSDPKEKRISRSTSGFNAETSAFQNESEFADVVKDTLRLGMNILIACNFYNFVVESEQKQRTIDVYLVGQWIPSDLDGTLSLMLQLSHIISISKDSKKKLLRFINIIAESDAKAQALEDLKELSSQTRILAELKVIKTSSDYLSRICRKSPPHAHELGRSYSNLEVARQSELESSAAQPFSDEYFLEMNSIANAESSESNLIFMVLPKPTKDFYLKRIRTLVRDLPPTILVGSGRRTNVIPQEL